VEPLTPDQAYEQLRQGHQRFLKDEGGGDGRSGARRVELADGQAPFVAILCCADSRMSPEIVFDTGLGDVFVVRVAGNVANPCSIASIEYAVAHLGTKLVAVVGHQSCGTVAAAVEGGDAGKNLNHLIGHINPALAKSGSTDVDTVARCNAQLNAERLVQDSEIIRQAVEDGTARIVSGFYHLKSGEVDIL